MEKNKMVQESEKNTTIGVIKSTLIRFSSLKLKVQAKINKPLSDDDFINFLITEYEEF